MSLIGRIKRIKGKAAKRIKSIDGETVAEGLMAVGAMAVFGLAAMAEMEGEARHRRDFEERSRMREQMEEEQFNSKANAVLRHFEKHEDDLYFREKRAARQLRNVLEEVEEGLLSSTSSRAQLALEDGIRAYRKHRKRRALFA